ncbi:MAG TPA: VIT1/CCC1 transporter family protein [bacterium]|nr:VIT1/CCC1 transporter family protein [bacterium]
MLHRLRTALTDLDRITDVISIARRNFVMNAFDGVLTMTGILAGSYFVGIDDPKIVLGTGFSTAIAMGISGMWGAFLTERSERRHDIKQLERHTLADLSDSHLVTASHQATIIITLVGLAPLLAALSVLSPFLFSFLFPSITMMYFSSLALIILLLFSLGTFLGTISKENILLSGLRLLAAGIICIGILLMIETL